MHLGTFPFLAATVCRVLSWTLVLWILAVKFYIGSLVYCKWFYCFKMHWGLCFVLWKAGFHKKSGLGPWVTVFAKYGLLCIIKCVYFDNKSTWPKSHNFKTGARPIQWLSKIGGMSHNITDLETAQKTYLISQFCKNTKHICRDLCKYNIKIIPRKQNCQKFKIAFSLVTP